MLYRDVLFLITPGEEQQNEDGYPIPGSDQSEKKRVFVNKKDVKSSEFYFAAQAGEKLEQMFELFSFDYNGQPQVEYQGKMYDVYRTYDKGEKIELVCKRYVP
ncbi:phage head closure protein [Priestia flexa]|uniref:phage head closure protein n=1 Tax=Priestia flexa TaxID=86664 RepID=UPI000C234F6A|nr:phage head closure protein [Priestia flexa]MEC0664485.1 phage head closure protein [Priestia flexa]